MLTSFTTGEAPHAGQDAPVVKAAPVTKVIKPKPVVVNVPTLPDEPVLVPAVTFTAAAPPDPKPVTVGEYWADAYGNIWRQATDAHVVLTISEYCTPEEYAKVKAAFGAVEA